jgi:hypothetical protein
MDEKIGSRNRRSEANPLLQSRPSERAHPASRLAWPSEASLAPRKQRDAVDTLEQEKSPGSGNAITSAIRKTTMSQTQPSNEKLNLRELASNF